jgi:hypothetical protein
MNMEVCCFDFHVGFLLNHKLRGNLYSIFQKSAFYGPGNDSVFWADNTQLSE